MAKQNGKLTIAPATAADPAGKGAKNLQGQRIGRKGRDTRDRLVAAARHLIFDSEDGQLSLSAVAREASLGMSSIYTYFKDMTELVLAVLEPTVAQSEQAYIGLIRERWPDETLKENVSQFVIGFHDFWQDNSQLLHLRNQMADRGDMRMTAHRIQTAQPVMQLLSRQMDGPPNVGSGDPYDMASVLFTGLERVVTMVTDYELRSNFPENINTRYDGGTIRQQAHLMTIAIADQRRRNAALTGKNDSVTAISARR